jgi:aquaporin Z
MKKYFAEFLGTLILVLVGCGCAVGANALFTAMGMGLPVAFTTLTIALAFGAVFTAMYYTLGSISGCHLNPAVSLGMLVSKRMEVKDFFGYIVAQFIGATAGAGLLALFVQGRTSLDANAYGTASTFGITVWMALGIELAMSFIFVLVFLGATDKKEKSAVAGIAIGIALVAVYLFSVPFTGGSANPARSFGPAIIQMSTAITQVWVFILAPFIGGLLAGLVNLVFHAEPGEKKEKKEKTGKKDKKVDPLEAAIEKDEAEEAEEEAETVETVEKAEEK